MLRRQVLRVNGFDELLAAYRRAREHDLEVVLLEEIPGADDRLCSYYTYLDESGRPCATSPSASAAFPAGQGIGCYHVTDWNPEARDLALRLLRHAGLQGVGNVEFKRDERDGRLKVIECNARFTAANGLLVASGWTSARSSTSAWPATPAGGRRPSASTAPGCTSGGPARTCARS